MTASSGADLPFEPVAGGPAGAGEEWFKVTGPLTFATAARLLPAGRALLRDHARLALDLAAVPRVDSAGLALLLQWRGDAMALGGQVRLLRPGASLLALASLSNLATIFEQDGNGPTA